MTCNVPINGDTIRVNNIMITKNNKWVLVIMDTFDYIILNVIRNYAIVYDI